MKDARPSFRKSSQPVSPQEACQPPGAKEEGGRPPLPLITTEALQTVQLRPVRKHSGTRGALLSEPASQEKPTPPVPQYHLKPSASLKSRNSINEMESESQPASVTSSLPTPARSMSQGHQDGAAERGRPSRSPGSAGEAEAGPGPGTAPLQRAPGPSPSKKPPPISKKPKLFLVVPPPQRDFTVEPAENASGAAPSPTRGEANERGGAAPAGSDETDSGCSVLEGGAAGSTSPARREANAPMVQPSASPAPKQEEPGTENSVDRGGHAEESPPALQDPGRESGFLSFPSDHVQPRQMGLMGVHFRASSLGFLRCLTLRLPGWHFVKLKKKKSRSKGRAYGRTEIEGWRGAGVVCSRLGFK